MNQSQRETNTHSEQISGQPSHLYTRAVPRDARNHGELAEPRLENGNFGTASGASKAASVARASIAVTSRPSLSKMDGWMNLSVFAD